MAGRAEYLYSQLQDAPAVLELIGEAEDAHLDCKEWPTKDDDAQKMLAKAASGMTNADGGVLVIGMKAESTSKDDPDVVTGSAPVSDTSLVKSKVLGLISNLVEPGIVGVEAREAREQSNSKRGFVVVYIPKSEGSPRRSRKDWKFYLRIGSATLPMEYWQIEDMFGKRPHPRLTLHIEGRDRTSRPVDARGPVREFVIGLKNEGGGIAKYPGIRFRRELGFTVDMYGIDGNHGFGIPLRPSESDWIVFRGGTDDVICPGETVLITNILQEAQDKGIEGIPITMAILANNREVKKRWLFNGTQFSCEISCENQPTITVEKAVREDAIIVDLPRF